MAQTDYRRQLNPVRLDGISYQNWPVYFDPAERCLAYDTGEYLVWLTAKEIKNIEVTQ